MQVVLLWQVDNQSWSNTKKSLKGVFATEDDAVKEIPEWAKNSGHAKRNPGQYGADGISYELDTREVVGGTN